MIDPSLLLPFVGASVVLMLIPGPNVALIVATSVGQGTLSGLLTVAGAASAMAAQLVAVGLGLAGLLGTLGHAFEWVRWIGAAYLVLLGIRQWRAPPVDLTRTAPPARSRRRVWTRAFLVSLFNPKTLLFYGAFFPQFVSPRAHAGARRRRCVSRSCWWRSSWTACGRWLRVGRGHCFHDTLDGATACPGPC